MSKTKFEKLEELLGDVKEAVAKYNLKAKEFNDYARVGYIYADHNGNVLELIDAGKEVGEDWEPDWHYGSMIMAPEASGWFPSRLCYYDSSDYDDDYS